MLKRNSAWILLVGLLSILCWQAAQSAPEADEDEKLYRLFVDAVEHVDRSYVKEVDRRKLIASAIEGMLSSLDPHSNFIQESDLEQFNRTTKGTFGGIGVQIHLRDGNVTVISPLLGSPAYEAGISAGDRILSVNGEDLVGLNDDQVVQKISGQVGTTVTLKILQEPYDQEPIEVTLERRLIHVESVVGYTHSPDDAWNFWLDPENKLAYIRVKTFSATTAEDLRRELDKLIGEGMRGLVLDLRYNPGGLLTAAIETADLFLKEGLIVSTKGRNTIEKPVHAKAEGTLPAFPMVVLVNRHSASASEIVSACLQDHGRAVVVGERSFGKGSVQNIIDLEDGESALKLTTANYCRPSGHPIHRFPEMSEEEEWGVKPDEGMVVPFETADHRAYLSWRGRMDRVRGKRTAPTASASSTSSDEMSEDTSSKSDAKIDPVEATEDPNPSSETPPTDSKDNANTESPEASGKSDPSDPKPGSETKEETGSEQSNSGTASDAAAEVEFEDRQLNKAIEVLRGKLKVAER